MFVCIICEVHLEYKILSHRLEGLKKDLLATASNHDRASPQIYWVTQ